VTSGTAREASAPAARRPTAATAARLTAVGPPGGPASRVVADSAVKMVTATARWAAWVVRVYPPSISPPSVTVTAPTVIWSGRSTTASVAASRTRRPPARHASAAVPRMANPVTIAQTRWNHSMKSGLTVSAGTNWSAHSGHWAAQASPDPVAAV